MSVISENSKLAVSKRRRIRPAGEVYITSTSNIVVDMKNDYTTEQINPNLCSTNNMFNSLRWRKKEINFEKETQETQIVSTYIDDLNNEPLYISHGGNEYENATYDNYNQTVGSVCSRTFSVAQSHRLDSQHGNYWSDHFSGDFNEEIKNDSNCDMNSIKLPIPPPSANQIYTLVRKFKSFVSNKMTNIQSLENSSNTLLSTSTVSSTNSTENHYNGGVINEKSKSGKNFKFIFRNIVGGIDSRINTTRSTFYTSSSFDVSGIFDENHSNDKSQKPISDTQYEVTENEECCSNSTLLCDETVINKKHLVADSSDRSDILIEGENTSDDDSLQSMFSNEPLYQIYSAVKLESISSISHEGAQDFIELEVKTQNKTKGHIKCSRPSALQLVEPKKGPSRTLWSEIVEVSNSKILDILTPLERRIQEAKFEILTSEASYFNSLNLLKTHFVNHPAFRDTSVLSLCDRRSLFAYIEPVHKCSNRLLRDLENCWQNNVMLLNLSRILYKHAEKYFHAYVSFCEHQGNMDRTLKRLKENKNVFNKILNLLEADPVCCGLNLHSFLMLPMQRITRFPLLIDAVFSKLKEDDEEYEDWKVTLSVFNKIVLQCNEVARRCEQAYEIEQISRQIHFPSNICPISITKLEKSARFLVKKGELVYLKFRDDDAKLTFGKKFTKSAIFLFLFTDLLVLTKKKSKNQFIVFDYCKRSMITVSAGETISHLPTKIISQHGKNFFLLSILENHIGKTTEMILLCPSVSEKQRWLQAFSPPESGNSSEKIYEQWDCPQVIAKHKYSATEMDLLSLEPGDVINVIRKMPDGWYQGERLYDGAIGWFPASYTKEVNSQHVRSKNLKQRYRLLVLTASYLETSKNGKYEEKHAE